MTSGIQHKSFAVRFGIGRRSLTRVARSVSLFLFVLLSLNFGASCSSDPFAAAQEADEEAGPMDEVDVDAQVLMRRVRVRENRLSEKDVDQLMYQTHGSKAETRKALKARLDLHEEDVSRVSPLSETQRKKLQLAGHADIQSLLDRCEQFKHEVLSRGDEDQGRGNLYWEFSSIRKEMEGDLFHADSIFFKTLQKTLSPEHIKNHLQVLDERRKFACRAHVELFVNMMEKVAPLRHEQRQKLIALFLEKAKVPRISTEYDSYLVMSQIVRTPEEKIKPILDRFQWKRYSHLVEQFKDVGVELKDQIHPLDWDLIAETADEKNNVVKANVKSDEEQIAAPKE